MSTGTKTANGNDSQMIKRCIMLLVGIFFMGTGIAMIIKSGTGTSPMSSLTNVMTVVFPALTLGTYTFLLNVLFFIGEFVVDIKSFSASKFLQLIPTFFLSVAVDLNMFLVSNLNPQGYVMKLAVLIIGCMFFGLSISFMVSADVILMPGEAFIKIISVKYHKEYGNIKTAVDVSLVILAVIVSLIFLGRIHGVREGMLIAAFTIGNFSRFFRTYTNKLIKGGCAA